MHGEAHCLQGVWMACRSWRRKRRRLLASSISRRCGSCRGRCVGLLQDPFRIEAICYVRVQDQEIGQPLLHSEATDGGPTQEKDSAAPGTGVAPTQNHGSPQTAGKPVGGSDFAVHTSGAERSMRPVTATMGDASMQEPCRQVGAHFSGCNVATYPLLTLFQFSSMHKDPKPGPPAREALSTAQDLGTPSSTPAAPPNPPGAADRRDAPPQLPSNGAHPSPHLEHGPGSTSRGAQPAGNSARSAKQPGGSASSKPAGADGDRNPRPAPSSSAVHAADCKSELQAGQQGRSNVTAGEHGHLPLEMLRFCSASEHECAAVVGGSGAMLSRMPSKAAQTPQNGGGLRALYKLPRTLFGSTSASPATGAALSNGMGVR